MASFLQMVIVITVSLSFYKSATRVIQDLSNTTQTAANSLLNSPSTGGYGSSFAYAFQGKQDFIQQKPDSNDEKVFEEAEYVYANQTFQYRYSTKLFDKFHSTKGSPSSSSTVLPSMVFGVCANSRKPVRRQAIRKSWAKDALVFFIVAGEWSAIEKEFYRTGDLLWINTSEDYRAGLTPKTFGFVDFGVTQLDQKHQIPWDYIFKTDDDVYVNVTHIRTEVALFDKSKGPVDYYGWEKIGSQPSRDPNDKKWYLPREAYPEDYFPPYAPGVGYALSRKFASCAAQEIPTTIAMPCEDVATGIVASRCGVSLSSATANWDHFPEQLARFHIELFREEGYLVKILHKVSPWYYEPLHEGKSLVDAVKYTKAKKRETAKRRRFRMDAVRNNRR